MIIGGLLVTHGNLGRILVEETIRITGKADRLESLMTSGLSASEITEQVSSYIQNDPWIVFSDCPGTAPTLRSYAAISQGQAVITGMNLGMLISFVFKRETMPIHELATCLIHDGQRSLEVLWPILLPPRED